MSVAVPRERDEAATVPDELESPTAKLVYLCLATAGRATVDELSTRLRMQKLALFSVLGTLEGRGVVECDGTRYELA